jgi:hypothetical protein
LLRLQSESGHDETGDNGDGSAEAGSTGDGNGGGGASSRGSSRLGGVDGRNGVALSRGVGRVGVDGRSSRASGSGSTVAGDRGGLDDGDEGGGRLGGVARDGQGLLNGDDGGVGTGSAVDLGDGDSLGAVVGGEGSGAIIAVDGGLVGGLGGLGGLLGSGLVGAGNLEGVGVLEDSRVALQLDDETVDVLVTEGSIDSPVVSLSVVGDTSWLVVSYLLSDWRARCYSLAMSLMGTWVFWESPPIREMVTSWPAYLAGASQVIWKLWPAATDCQASGLKMGSKSAVWAKALAAKARKAAAEMVNCILAVDLEITVYKNRERLGWEGSWREHKATESVGEKNVVG